MTELPKVSVVIVNLNGINHLKQCFASIEKLNYPKDKLEVIVVDNGSNDGSAEYINEKYVWIKLIINKKNEGFAKPCNDGARAASGEYVAFLNNDMKVKCDWLTELIASLKASSAVCAGSVILSWNGDQLDFAGGSVSFYGMGYQYNFHKQMRQVEPTLKCDKEIMFACGGAMIIDRRIFLETGGFDEDYFAYYEDVDLGWRLNILGYKVVLSVKSRVFHRHHGTSGSFAKEYRNMLFERNSLYTLFKNTGDELLQKAFLPTVLMNASMIFNNSKLRREDFDLHINDGELMADGPVITNLAAVELCAINDFVLNIGKMSVKRTYIQANRKIGDEELIRFIDDPFIALRSETNNYSSIKFDLAKAFGTDVFFKKEIRRRVLIVADSKTPSQSRRSSEFAKALSSFCKVVIASTGQIEIAPDNVNVIEYGKNDTQRLIDEAVLSDIIVLQSGIIKQSRQFDAVASSKYLVIDMCAPDFLETQSTENCVVSKAAEYALSKGDFFLCSSEAQKELCLSLLSVKNDGVGGSLCVVPADRKQTNHDCNEKFKEEAEIKLLIDYCVSPAHRIDRNNFQRDMTNVSEDAQDAELRNNTSKMSVLQRLSRIESHQAMVEKLIRRNVLFTENTRDSLDGISQWTRQMDIKLGKLGRLLGPFRRIFKK
jgi:GT2 family glycosyltransferase